MSRWAFACLLGATAMLPPAAALAYCRLTTDMPLPGDNCSFEGVGLEWRRTCIAYSLTRRDAASPRFEALRNATLRSFETWNDVSCGDGPFPLEVVQTVELGECEEPEYSTRGPNANTILFVHDWEERELPEEAFGLTLVWHDPDDGEIFDADMQINETLGQLAICDGTCPDGQVDFENVMTHEVGHFLGLGHTPVRHATMSARAQLGEIDKRSLERDDIEGVCAIYPDREPPMCSRGDYQPDRGFTAECSVDTTVRSCSCRVPGGDRSGGAAIVFGLALTALVLVRRR